MTRNKNALSSVKEKQSKRKAASVGAKNPKRTQRNAAKIAVSMITESMKMENCGNKIRRPEIFDPNQMMSLMDIYKANLRRSCKQSGKPKPYLNKGITKKKLLKTKQMKGKHNSKIVQSVWDVNQSGQKSSKKGRRKQELKESSKNQNLELESEEVLSSESVEEVVSVAKSRVTTPMPVDNNSITNTSENIEPIKPIYPFKEEPQRKICVQGLSSLDLDMCDSDTEHYNVNYSKLTMDWFKARDYDSKNARNPMLFKLFCTKAYNPTMDELFKSHEEKHLMQNSNISKD